MQNSTVGANAQKQIHAQQNFDSVSQKNNDENKENLKRWSSIDSIDEKMFQRKENKTDELGIIDNDGTLDRCQ